jgi:hypothetical protein
MESQYEVGGNDYLSLLTDANGKGLGLSAEAIKNMDSWSEEYTN